jgi:hypothetical protein
MRPTIIKDVQEVGLIAGQKAGSSLEWVVAQALWKLKFVFDYQVSVNGGRMRGGTVIDFLVHTAPLYTPLYSHGEYWHKGRNGMDDDLTIANVKRGLARMGISATEPVIVWGAECPNVDAATRVLQKRLGHG